MDPLGNAVRDMLRRQRDDMVRTASSLAEELKSEGMTSSQVEEMLFASGFESDVVSEAMDSFPEKE